MIPRLFLIVIVASVPLLFWQGPRMRLPYCFACEKAGCTPSENPRMPVSQVLFYIARAMGAFLLLSNIVGLLWFWPKLSNLWIVHGALAVLSLSVFCFMPRSWLRRTGGVLWILPVAAMGATLPVAYKDIILVNGADHGALMFRLLLVAILAVMLVEIRSLRTRP